MITTKNKPYLEMYFKDKLSRPFLYIIEDYVKQRLKYNISRASYIYGQLQKTIKEDMDRVEEGKKPLTRNTFDQPMYWYINDDIQEYNEFGLKDRWPYSKKKRKEREKKLKKERKEREKKLKRRRRNRFRIKFVRKMKNKNVNNNNNNNINNNDNKKKKRGRKKQPLIDFESPMYQPQSPKRMSKKNSKYKDFV